MEHPKMYTCSVSCRVSYWLPRLTVPFQRNLHHPFVVFVGRTSSRSRKNKTEKKTNKQKNLKLWQTRAPFFGGKAHNKFDNFWSPMSPFEARSYFFRLMLAILQSQRRQYHSSVSFPLRPRALASAPYPPLWVGMHAGSGEPLNLGVRVTSMPTLESCPGDGWEAWSQGWVFPFCFRDCIWCEVELHVIQATSFTQKQHRVVGAQDLGGSTVLGRLRGSALHA